MTGRAAWRRLLAMVVVVVTTGLSVVLAGPAGAHAVLLGSAPAADELLDTAPAEVVLSFSESVEVAADGVVVLDPSGEQVPGVRAAADGRTVRAALPDLDRDGSYTVTWSVVSADGHPVRGAQLFHLRERTLDAAGGAGSSGSPWQATLLRWLGSVAAVSGLVWVFAAWFLGRRPRWRWTPVVLGTLLAAVGSVVAVGPPWSDAVAVVADTTNGRVAALAFGVALVGAVLSTMPRAEQAELAAAGAATVAVAAQGHAISVPPVALSASLTVLHVVAAVAWATALVWLERRCRTEDPERLQAAVRRGSPWGMAAVAVLAVTGVVLVLERVEPGELLDSAYGRLASVKVALLVVALGLAVHHRWRAAPGGAMARSLRVEVVVLALALVAGGLLAQVAPPEDTGAAPTGGTFVQRAAFGEGEVELRVEPGRRGSNEVHVTALGPDGRLMAGADDLSVALTLESRDVGPLEPEMVPITTGHSVAYAEIPLPGRWTVDVTARPSRFEELRASFEVPVGE